MAQVHIAAVGVLALGLRSFRRGGGERAPWGVTLQPLLCLPAGTRGPSLVQFLGQDLNCMRPCGVQPLSHYSSWFDYDHISIYSVAWILRAWASQAAWWLRCWTSHR